MVLHYTHKNRSYIFEAQWTGCEFESVLIQMTDLSRLLEQLTATQRERLVKHIFLNYTLQEIADQEGTSRQSVSESITAALKKLRALL